MTTLNEAREAIYLAFQTGWGGTSVYTFGNDSWTPPAAAKWARTVVRHDASFQESLGGVGDRKFTRAGSVIVQCFAPLDAGEGAADNLATTARNIFEGKTLTPEGIRFTDAVVREIGEDGAWFQTNMEAFFTYTETK